MSKNAKKVATKASLLGMSALVVAAPVAGAQDAATPAETTTPETNTTATAATEVAVPNTDELKAKVAEAEKAGVKVTTGDTETRDFSLTEQDQQVKDAEADYKSQIDKLDAAIETQKAHDDNFALAVAARDSIIEQNKSIDASNANAKEVYDAAVEAQKQAEEANKKIEAKRAEIQASNDQGLKDALAKHDAYVEALNLWTERTQAILASNAQTNTENSTKLAEASKAVSDATTDTEREKAVTAYNNLVSEINLSNEKIEAENQKKLDSYNSELQKAVEERDAALKLLSENEAKNTELRTAFEAAMADYVKKMADFSASNAEYQRILSEQMSSGDPNTAIVAPDYLSYEQPFNFKTDLRDALVSVTPSNASARMESLTADQKSNPGTLFNSDRGVNVAVQNGDSVEAVWNGVAVDKDSGRALNLRITYSNIVVNNNWVSWFSDFQTPTLEILSNPVDNVGLYGIDNVDMKIDYLYADTGEAYDKKFYVSNGSLDRLAFEDNGEGTFREYAAPKDGVISTFIHKDSLVPATAQPVVGNASSVTPNAFFVTQNGNYPADLANHVDDRPEIIQKLGVTFLVNNGATVAIGESYDPNEVLNRAARDVRDENGGQPVVSGPYNHNQMTVMTVAPTIAQPTPPTEPTPPSYESTDISIPDLPVPPELEDSAAVTPLTTSPTEPSEFIPDPLPDFLPVPPVPDYNPTPKLTVPEEPVKEQAEVDVRYLKLMLQPTDLRIAKTVIDSDASDGTIAFRIDGTNAGTGTAHEAIVSDLMGEGITSIKLSDLTYNGESVSDNKARIDGDKLYLKDVASGDAYSFTVTAEVDPNADVVTNAVKVTSPDDPNKGGDGETQRNDTPEDDTDGKDEETTPVKNQAKVRIDKKMTSFDEETGVATFEVTGINEKAIAHSVVIEDFGGTGLSDIKVESFSSKLGDKTSTPATEEAQPSAEATDEATAAPTDGAGSDVVVPTAEAQPTEETTPVPVESTAVEPERISLSAGQTGTVNVFADANDVADLKLGEPSGPVSVKWDGGQSVEVTLKDNAIGEIKIPYTITRDGQSTEGYILVTVVDAEGNPTGTETDAATEEAFVAPKASEQGDLKATDVNDLDDYTIDGAKVTVDAMGVGETFTAIVTAKVADDARTIDNAVGVTTPDDPEAKGKDGDQVNEDVPSDTDGWDKTTEELDRPADLKVLKEAVDSDASDHKVSFRITGSNIGVGDSPETVIAEMADARVGLENPVISDVKLGDAELDSARYTVAEDNESVTVDDLKAGETVSYLIEFDVTPGATEITNAASITSPKSPVDPNGDIQDNEDIPGDNDQKDKSTIDPTPVDLKVLKEVVDGDASDGKLSFKVTGANLGTGNAPETRITDEFAEGLKNPVISEVSEGATIIEEDGVTGILVDDLKAGAEASFIVEFDVEPGVTFVSNAAFIDSPFDPVDPNGDIQDNNDLPGDEDQKDKTSLDLGEGQLKVDKEVVEGDLSDGKVTFKISGMNSGATVEQDVLLKDAEREGLVNGVISEVQAPEGVETSVNGEALTLSQLKPGEQANFLITFEVLPDANAYSNVATIESKDLKPGDGEVQENEGLDADTDQKDRVSLEKPAEPETPAPSDPADPTDPANPADPANPGDPAQTTVKGESAGTGGQADVAKKGALTGLAALLATAGGIITFRAFRKSESTDEA